MPCVVGMYCEVHFGNQKLSIQLVVKLYLLGSSR
jgi:hypothetical protein